METRFILLGLAADPADYAAEAVITGEAEQPAVLTYRQVAPYYTGWILVFLVEFALELLIELPVELIFGG